MGIDGAVAVEELHNLQSQTSPLGVVRVRNCGSLPEIGGFVLLREPEMQPSTLTAPQRWVLGGPALIDLLVTGVQGTAATGTAATGTAATSATSSERRQGAAGAERNRARR